MWTAVEQRLDEEGFFPQVVVRTVRLYGIGEMQVAPILERAATAGIETGINVGRGEVAVRLRGPASPQTQAHIDAVVAALRAQAPVFSDDGRTVDDIVADALRGRGESVAVAESCTGGLLGARLTERAGSSDYVAGGVISYANEVKQGLLAVPAGMLAQYGAVSEQVARAMAEGVRAATGSTWSLSVTGVAGPAGGTPDKPVGLVWLGCAGPPRTVAVAQHFPGDRATVREYSTTAALHLLRTELSA
jgi:nicotinamide-nucleotide amidase